MIIYLKAINILKRNVRNVHFSSQCYYDKMTSNIGKRSKMLNKYVENKDKKKHWHLNFMSKPQNPKNIFDKVHKPSRRISVLNSLFIRNITDVLSTSDIAPEVLQYGIEITNIEVTSDYQTVNVYYDVPLNKLDSSACVQKILSKRAPQLRAELIGRNILGKVPKLYFVRDHANSQLAEFEEALKSADLGPEDKERIVPEEDFLKKKLFSFTTAREKKLTDAMTSNENKVQETHAPKIPADMKSNVLGLNHDSLMTRLCASKKQVKSASVEENLNENENNDLFSQIPGIPLQPSDDRVKILKKFCLDRKIMMKEKTKMLMEMDNEENRYCVEISDDSAANSNYEADYFDEEENVR